MKNTINVGLLHTEWLQDFFDHAHDLIQIVQLDGTLLYVNNSWSSQLEYALEEIQGKTIYSFIDEPHRLRYQLYRQEVIDGIISGQPIVFDLRAKSGRLVNVEGIVSVKREGKKPVYTRGIFRDITLRVQNEAKLNQLNKELLQREENLQHLLINAPDAVVVIDQQSRITFWNPKAESMFGWRAEEVLQQPLHTLIIPPQYRQAHRQGMDRYLATTEAHVLHKTIEITALKKSGQEFHISLTIAPTYQAGQLAFIGFLRDITQQKQNQLELEKKTKELEQFMYVSHHDLQEPIRKIILFSQLIKADSYEQLTEASRHRLDRVLDAAQRMMTALKDVLNYASLSKEELLSPVNLTEVLAAVKTDLELVIAEKQARIEADTLPMLLAIRGQMHQLVYNLINNSLKFTRPDVPATISIRCNLLTSSPISRHPELEPHKSYYELVFEDNGIGFKPELAGKIFGMFQRLHSKQAYAGTGIGLALCKKIVLNHGGVIWAEGKEGEGAIFHVLLPAD